MPTRTPHDGLLPAVGGDPRVGCEDLDGALGLAGRRTFTMDPPQRTPPPTPPTTQT